MPCAIPRFAGSPAPGSDNANEVVTNHSTWGFPPGRPHRSGARACGAAPQPRPRTYDGWLDYFGRVRLAHHPNVISGSCRGAASACIPTRWRLHPRDDSPSFVPDELRARTDRRVPPSVHPKHAVVDPDLPPNNERLTSRDRGIPSPPLGWAVGSRRAPRTQVLNRKAEWNMIR